MITKPAVNATTVSQTAIQTESFLMLFSFGRLAPRVTKIQGPVVEKELTPEVAGIVISADGGGNASVRAEISEAMEALFGLPAHKIKVLKRVKEGV